MKKLLIAVLFFSLVAFAQPPQAKSADKGSKDKKPKLTISVQPHQGFAPMHTNFHAVLENVADDNKEFHCLKEEWDFGDGSISSEKADCGEKGEDEDSKKTKVEFFADHTYENEGHYVARLTIGEKKLSSGKASIVVLQNPSSPN